MDDDTGASADTIQPIESYPQAEGLCRLGHGISIYRDDLQELLVEFSKYADKFEWKTSKFIYPSPNVLSASRKENRIDRLEISFVKTTPDDQSKQYSVDIIIEMDRFRVVTFSGDPAAHEIVRRIYKFLYGRPRRHLLFNGKNKIIFSIIGAILVGFSGLYMLSPHPLRRLFVVLLLAGEAIVFLPLWKSPWRNTINVREDRSIKGWLEENKNALLVGLICSVVSSLLSIAATWVVTSGFGNRAGH